MNQGTGAQHGTAEHSYRSRHRQRSPHRTTHVNPVDARANPAGQEEAIDWLTALAGVHDRLDALERFRNLHATSLARLAEEGGYTSNNLKIVMNDIGAYKNHITNTHENMDKVITARFSEVPERLDSLKATIDSMTEILPPSMTILDAKLKELEKAIAENQTVYEGKPVGRGTEPPSTLR